MKLTRKIIKRFGRPTSFSLIFVLLFELCNPVGLYALTGGPSQPEVQSFQPVSVSEMVNPFTGDFSYNIPLIDVDGYPINLIYNSGITNDQEASWVGLGWNINPGVINRSMRGLPDEFNGEIVEKELNMKKNYTIGATFGSNTELFGTDYLKLGYSLGIHFNNYSGYGVDMGLTPSVSASAGTAGTMTGRLGLNSSSDGGLTIAPDLSFENKVATKNYWESKSNSYSIGSSFNSRAGLSSLTFSISSSITDIIDEKITNSGGSSGGITFGMTAYTPTIGTQMKNYSTNFSFKTGTELFGGFPNMQIQGYYSSQGLKETKTRIPAFGYLNSQNVTKDGNVVKGLMDFNREMDQSYSKNTPALPYTNYTYDIYNVSGQGISGTFRPFKGVVGNVSDNESSNTSAGGSLGGELGAGNLLHGGMDISLNQNTTRTQNWYQINHSDKDKVSSLAAINFTNGPNNQNWMNTFKEMGELSVDDDPIFNNYAGSEPVRVALEKNKKRFEPEVLNYLLKSDGSTIPYPTVNNRTNEFKRNQVFQQLSYDEVNAKGLLPNQTGSELYAAPGNHTAEISVIRNDGSRYVYGMPTYNLTQEETSFSVGMITDVENPKYENKDLHKKNYKDENGLFYYHTGDNSVGNERGRDNYYSSTKMPAFAHAYMLSAVLSPDYVDIDQERGPSKGDIGNYTLFKYKKLDHPYKWRTPYDPYGMSANYNEGLKSDYTDDQANYVYGEKEIRYLDKIETKNTVAVFYTEDRKDAFESAGRDGGMGKMPMKLLRKIVLYSKPDYDANGVNAIPIKEVHFEYDYSLCPNVPNNNGVAENVNGTNLNAAKGKLTLKKVYFTYGTSYKSKFSPYTFDYTNSYSSSFNPEYGLKNYDRWGNYKPNSGSLLDPTNPLSIDITNSEFPYVEQNKALADMYSSAWTLSKIKLPSGGTINIESESDDYAYVQDKKAMEMFKVFRIGNSISEMNDVNFPHNKLMDDYQSGSGTSNRNNLYVSFKLDNPITGTPAEKKAIIYKYYLSSIDNLYFKFLVNIKNSQDPHYEYVNGYAEIDFSNNDYGIMTNSGVDYGYFKLKTVNQGDKAITADVNPISKVAWHFGRKNLSRVLYNDELPDGYQMDEFIQKVKDAAFVKNIVQTVMGANGYLKNENMGKEVCLSHSFVRLNCPSLKKLGGGSRVKRITINDEWNTMVPSENSTSYGQEYTYTTNNSEGELISSGVAAYEPAIGNDENPFRQPIWFGDKNEKLLMPDDKSFLEEPIGEAFYPSPTIGYSKVTVKSFGNSNVKRHGTGKIINEYYTAKDFPSISLATEIDPVARKTPGVLKPFKFNYRDFVTVSQGYSIEINDMHGKQKAMWVYAEDNYKPISGMEYKYKCSKYNSESFKLTNSCTVVKPDGTYHDANIGVEFDMVADLREQRSETWGGGVNTNLTSFLAALIPVVSPFILPTVSHEKTQFRSAVLTKVIYRYGILEETIAHDLGSSVSTKNLAYDSETGLVLLTKTKNNFEDEIYSFNYPAHWFYDGMGQAYKNLGITIPVSGGTNGVFSIANANNYFTPGDEILFNKVAKAWVIQVTPNDVTLVNEMGNPFIPKTTDQTFRNTPVGNESLNPPDFITIVRSGRRNMIGTSMGSITSLDNPLPNLRTNYFTMVLNASAVVFKDDWKTLCECFTKESALMKSTKNPYAIGAKGSWKAFKSYAFLTDRNLTLENNNTNIRKDGVYKSFNPFWKWDNNHWTIDESNWTWTSEVTLIDPFGGELENMDALNRYSSAVYGYNHSLPTAIAANARFKEIGFDGFEDYGFNNCEVDHFSFKKEGTTDYISKLTLLESHSGKKSIKIGAGDAVYIKKNLTICPGY